MKRLETLYAWYATTIVALMLLCGQTVPDRWTWVLGHLAVFPVAAWLSRQRDVVRYFAACALVMTAFSTMGLYIEDLVPAPFHWNVARWDAAVGGAAVQRFFETPPTWLIELCQLCYSTFYFLPIALGVALGLEGKRRALEHTAVLIVGGFLLSYQCYLLAPTLPPYRFLDYPAPLAGGTAFAVLNPLLYDLEALRQDCMPSGHTMMTLLTIGLAWRWSRRHLVWLLPIAAFLILGTLVLRYHWFVDLLVALPLVVVAWLLFPPPPADVRTAAAPGPG